MAALHPGPPPPVRCWGRRLHRGAMAIHRNNETQNTALTLTHAQTINPLHVTRPPHKGSLIGRLRAKRALRHATHH